MGALGERLRWMDQARGVAILLVVMHHSMTWVADFGLTVPPALIAFDDIVSPFRMPLLMFLSGILVPRALSKPTRAYATELRAIGWPDTALVGHLPRCHGDIHALARAQPSPLPADHTSVLMVPVGVLRARVVAGTRGNPAPVAGSCGHARLGLRARGLPDVALLVPPRFLPASGGRGRRGDRCDGRRLIRRLAIGAGLAAAVAVPAMSVAGVQVRYEPAYAWGWWASSSLWRRYCRGRRAAERRCLSSTWGGIRSCSM